MSFYNELRRRIRQRYNLPDVLKDFVDRIEYLEARINGEEVLDPHPMTYEQMVHRARRVGSRLPVPRPGTAGDQRNPTSGDVGL